MAVRKHYTNIIGIVILILGLLAGVVLVDQARDYRNKAKEAENLKYTVCHKTGMKENPWEQIKVNENDLKMHIDHGDTIGECPTPDLEK